LKKLSESRLQKIVGDAHEFKEDIAGGQVSRYDVYVDKSSGYLFLIAKSGDDPIPTYFNMYDDGP
jgi:hypothetical protein